MRINGDHDPDPWEAIPRFLGDREPSQRDRLDARWASVVSLAYGARNNYLDYGHPNFSSDEQMSVVRGSFRESAGQRVLVPSYRFEEAYVTYAGSWSRVDSTTSTLGAEFTTGAATGLVGATIDPRPEPSGFTQVPTFSGGVAVVSDSGYNIHQFIWEHLPAIHLFRDIVAEHGRLLVGVSDEGPHAFVRPLLALVGLDVEVVTLPLHSRVSLYDTTVLGTFPFRVYPMDLVTQVRDLVLSNVAGGTRKPPHVSRSAVFLGRGDAERNRRKLGNETAVLNVLRATWPELKTIRSALCPLEATIESLRGCRILVGPTGGALAHALWATELEHLVELVPEEYPGTTEAEEASELLGFRYHRVAAHRSEDRRDIKWVNADHDADVTALRSVLNEIAT